MKSKVLIAAALSGMSLLAQGPVTGAVKPALNTAKLWRLVAKSQSLRSQLDSSELGKAVQAAESELQAEQQRLIQLCGVGQTLGLDQDPKSSTYQDVICVAKPKETAAAPPPSKEK